MVTTNQEELEKLSFADLYALFKAVQSLTNLNTDFRDIAEMQSEVTIEIQKRINLIFQPIS